MLIVLLIAVSIVVVLEADDFNSSIDALVVFYGLASFAFVVVALRTFRSGDELDIDNRVFTYKKASKLENLTWKQKFFGSYEKYERTGMAEYMIFNGAPAFIANSLAKGAFTLLVEHKPGDETIVRVSATGTPVIEGAFLPTTDSEETSPYVDYMDRGKPYKARLWWDESTKQLHVRYTDKNGWTGCQYWKLLDDQTMYMHATLTKQTGESTLFDVYLKRL